MISNSFGSSNTVDKITGQNYPNPCNAKITFQEPVNEKLKLCLLSYEHCNDLKQFNFEFNSNFFIYSEWKLYNKIPHYNLVHPFQKIKFFQGITTNTETLE